MSVQTTETRVSLLDSPPPPVVAADGEPLNDAQWETLLALMDAVIPSIVVGNKPSRRALTLSAGEYGKLAQGVRDNADTGATDKDVEAYLSEAGSSTPAFRDLARRMFCDYVRKDQMDLLSMLMTTLGTRAGSLVLTGSATPLAQQSVAQRHQVIMNWCDSYLTPLKGAGKSVTLLAKSIYIKTSLTFPKVIGIPRIPVHGNQGEGYDFQFMQFPPGDKNTPEEIYTDVVIVGSGCGAGVAAKNLAEAGHSVIVTEKAYHFAPKHLPMSEHDGSINLFENGGVDITDDQNTYILSGSAWGGGGTVNWSASLQTQDFVRKEWAEERKLPFFASAEFQNCLDRIFERMGASTDHIEHNHTNRMLMEGARRLGYSAKPVAQNTGGTKHYCGYCTMGCGSCEKQGPAVSFLPDAHRAGAQFIEGYTVEKVLFEKHKKTGKQVAVGIEGTWMSRDEHGGVAGPYADRTVRKVIVRAKRVIVSGGSLQSPLLLLRSGLKNPHIGRHLHLHPCQFLAPVFDYQTNPWEGGILTSVVSSLENMDGDGHGPKIEALTALPGIWLPSLPWITGPKYKLLASEFNHTAPLIGLVRERDTGRVYPDPHNGKARIDYVPSKHTSMLCTEGLIAMSKIAYAAGARKIITGPRHIPIFVREDPPAGQPDPGVNDAKFQEWLAHIRKTGLPLPQATYGSAHQMGSNRMSARAADGVVDPRGRVWGTQGLYVMDASVFPSASGVNPMVTNMAITDWTSRLLAEDLTLETRTNGAKARL